MIYILALVFMGKNINMDLTFNNLKDCEIKAKEFMEDNYQSKFICIKK